MHDIDVYGYITSDKLYSDDVTAKEFIAALREAGGDEVTVHINSGGGDTMEAAAMAEAISAYNGHVVASIEGLAASAASYFALSADEVVMNPYAFMMVHNPSGACFGTSEDMRGTAEVLDKVRGTIVSQYARKTGMDGSELGRMMDAETWMTAEEAKSLGFVDSLTDAEPVTACIDARSASRYRHVPRFLVDSQRPRADAVGHARDTIHETAEGAEPVPVAGKEGAGAAPKLVCVDGVFLNAKENENA